MRVIPTLLAGLALLEGNPAMAATPCRLDSLDWLLGNWTTAPGNRVIREEWTRISPDTWEGTGRTLAGGSGSILAEESLRLVGMADGVFYLAKVDHNELPTAFRLTECDPGHAVFENPAHDFPRRLDYRLSPEGRLTVLVSDGADKGFTLEFRRDEPASPGPCEAPPGGATP